LDRDYWLKIVYPGYDREIDRRLFKLVGAWSDGSGCWVQGKNAGLRDHEWFIKTRAKALRALRKVRAAKIKGLKAVLVGPIEL
jgi:hypothetical protein